MRLWTRSTATDVSRQACCDGGSQDIGGQQDEPPGNPKPDVGDQEQEAKTMVGLPRTLIVVLALLIAAVVIGVVVFTGSSIQPNASNSTSNASYRLTADFPDLPKVINRHGAFLTRTEITCHMQPCRSMM